MNINSAMILNLICSYNFEQKKFSYLLTLFSLVILSLFNACSDNESQGCPALPAPSAGTDFFACENITEITLNGSIPQQGVLGTWTIISGEGGVLNDINDPNSSFSGTLGETYTLRWSVVNDCEEKFDEISISFGVNLEELISAGNDMISIEETISLQATALQTGDGIWTIEEGEGGSLDDVNDANATFTGELNKTYRLRWTYIVGSCTTFDEISVRFTDDIYKIYRIKKSRDEGNTFGTEYFYTNGLLTKLEIYGQNYFYETEYEYDAQGTLMTTTTGEYYYNYIYNNGVLERIETFSKTDNSLQFTRTYFYESNKLSYQIQDYTYGNGNDSKTIYSYGANGELLTLRVENLQTGTEYFTYTYTYYPAETYPGKLPPTGPISNAYSDLLRHTLSQPNNPNQNYEIEYEFDDLGRLIKEIYTYPNSPSSSYTQIYEYELID